MDPLKLSLTWTNRERGAFLLENVIPEMRRAAIKIMRLLAQKYLWMLKLAVLQHGKAGLNWPPLSDTTKRLHGSHHILRLTGEYYRLLRIKEVGSGESIQFHIGAQPEDMHTTSDDVTGQQKTISMAKLTEIFEYGNPNNKLFGNPAPIPPRPFVRRVTDEFIKKVAQTEMTKEAIKAVDAYWR